MALSQSPQIVTNGLVFYYDANNRSKSYRGEPTTNQFAIPTPYDSNGNVTFSVQGNGIYRRIYSGTFGGYDIQPSDIVYRYDLGANGCHYHGNDATITAGQFPTFTFDYYLSPDVTSFGDTFMASFENLGSGISASASLPNLQKGIWQTIQINGSAASSTSGLRMLLYTGGCSGGRLAATGYLLMKNPQVTFSSVSGKVLPFVAGTRSNTQSIIDLTGNYTLTPNNLTYNTNGTFSFNGASWLDLNSNNIITGTQPFTVESFYTTTGSTADEIFGNYGSGSTTNTLWISGRYGVYINGSVYFPGAPIGAGTYHLAATRNTNGTVVLYQNGVQVSSGTLSASIAVTYNFRIGADVNGGGEPFTGNIHSVKVYNRNLSASEVLQNFNAQRGIYGI